MTTDQDAFREYLNGIADELLDQVAVDYIWLAAQSRTGVSKYDWRREACGEECARRGRLENYRLARKSFELNN